MAIFGEIWTGRHLKGLNKIFGIRAPESRLTVSPEVMPVIDIEDDDLQWERRLLGDVRSYAGGTEVGASVGNFSVIELQYPAASNANSIVVLEKVIVGLPAAGLFGIYIGVPQLGGGFAVVPLDTRQGASVISTAGVARVVTGVLAASPTVSAVIRLPAGSPFTFELQSVLTAGFAFGIIGNVVNLAVAATFVWHEREADPLELNV